MAEEHDEETINDDAERAFEQDTLTDYERNEFKNLLNGEMIDDVTEEAITIFSEEIENLPRKVREKKTGWRSLFIDFDQLCTWIPTLRMKLKMSPAKVIDELSSILESVIEEKYTEDFLEQGYFHVRPVPNVSDEESGFDNISSKMIGKLVNLKGIVSSMKRIQPYPKVIVFHCARCGYKYELEIKSHSVYYPPPKTCPNQECPSKGVARWNISTYKSKYVDFQRITLQEEPDFLSASEQPRFCKVVFTDDIVGIVKPGSRVSVAGLLVPTPEFNETKKIWDYSLFDLHVYAFNIQPKNSEEVDLEKITDQRREEIMDFVRANVQDRDAYFEELRKAVAPMIYGHDDIKSALLCVAVGGQTYIPTKGSRIRGTINVLLVGDPGSGKTKLIEGMGSIISRFEYGSGQASTKAGMLAAVVKEGKEEAELVAGIVVRADGGVAAIDEFDKIDKNDKSALHEQMEHGKVSINKYRFHETLNARTSIVGAANPKGGQLKSPEEETIQKQINDIPIPIQSRFDLIFLVEDVVEADKDRKMLEQMFAARSIEYAKPFNAVDVDIESEVQKHVSFVKDLIIIAKKHADENPIDITEAAKNRMVSYYIEKREKSYDPETGRKRTDLPIPITPRQFESLHRISTAFAKLTFSNQIDIDHVNRAISIIDESMKQVMMDEDGNIDAGMGTTGISQTKVRKDKTILRVLYQMEEERKKEDPDANGVGKKELKEKLTTETKMNADQFEKVLERLITDGNVRFVDGKNVKITSNGRIMIGIE